MNAHQTFDEVREPKRPIQATPYVWTDPATIPRRDWLYARSIIRGFASGTVAPGGVGKSSLKVVQALAMASGKNLLGDNPFGRPLRVWVINLEDPMVELQRRIQAAAKHYGLGPEDIAGRLFVDSGRDQPVVIAHMTRNGAKIIRPASDALIGEAQARNIDVISVDPFVSCHEVGENDNTAIDMVAKEWGAIAHRGNCGVDLVHHTRKANGEAEVTTESARGAKALTDACRSVQVINRMTKDEGDRAGVDNHRLYFRVFSDKLNLAPPLDKSEWYRLESIDLGNDGSGFGAGPGDSVGVVVPWQWPDALAGMSAGDLLRVQQAIDGKALRKDVQAKDWVGHTIADVLGLDSTDKAVRARMGGMIKMWLASGALKTGEALDEKRRMRATIEVGEWAT